ncbi:MAG: hypothetical protein WBZ37_22520 [Mycobacterium sp.]
MTADWWPSSKKWAKSGAGNHRVNTPAVNRTTLIAAMHAGVIAVLDSRRLAGV